MVIRSLLWRPEINKKKLIFNVNYFKEKLFVLFCLSDMCGGVSVVIVVLPSLSWGNIGPKYMVIKYSGELRIPCHTI